VEEPIMRPFIICHACCGAVLASRGISAAERFDIGRI
jgi:hypothetical protein